MGVGTWGVTLTQEETMKRLTVLILGVLAFAFCYTPSADAGVLARFRQRRVTVEKKVTKKIDVKRKHAVDRRLPTCAGGACVK